MSTNQLRDPYTIFGVKKVGVIPRTDSHALPKPVEIEQIQRGGFAEYVGLFINEGVADWRGFNLDTNEIIRVFRFSESQQVFEPPFPEVETENHFVREVDESGETFTEIVAMKPVQPEHLPVLIQWSNELWKSTEIHFQFATDTANELFLIDGEVYKNFGGPGDLTGAAAEIERLLDSYFK